MVKRKLKGNPNATITMPVVNPHAAGIDDTAPADAQ